MLEFIVLGQIPGTNVYLSFSTILAAITILGFALTVFESKRHAFKQKQATQNSIESIAI